MSGIRSITRRPSQAGVGVATQASAPIRVDSNTNQIRIGNTGSGSTENLIQTGADAPVTLTANTTLSQALHAGVPIVFNNVAGGTITLPAATGSGAKYNIFIGTTLTSGSFVVQVASGTDYLR